MGVELGVIASIEEVCAAGCVADWTLDVTVKLVLIASESAVETVVTKVAGVHWVKRPLPFDWQIAFSDALPHHQ